ncbi:hypothetical protein ACD591_10000 [Rufibacter glacialis]|nr:hypothetical protein [Rufibacter glacialis]
MKDQIEVLLSRYRHEVHLYETLIRTKLDALNSEALFVNPNASQGDILEFLECKVKIHLLYTVIRDLETTLGHHT